MSLIERPRRLRRSASLRNLVRETQVTAHDLICPFFVCPGKNIQREISALPGQYHWSVDRIAAHAGHIAKLGIPAVLLFGCG